MMPQLTSDGNRSWPGQRSWATVEQGKTVPGMASPDRSRAALGRVRLRKKKLDRPGLD